MDYEKLRKKREAEGQARLDAERADRRIKEEKERQRLRKEQEKRRWDEMAMSKQKQRHGQDIEDATKKSQELIKQLEDKKRQAFIQAHAAGQSETEAEAEDDDPTTVTATTAATDDE